LSKLTLNPHQGINILVTHYPTEGFSAYFGEEPFIRLSSIPKAVNLVAAGHLHRHKTFRVGGTAVVCSESTGRASYVLLPEVKGKKPEFIFLDEPLGSSDEVRRSGILKIRPSRNLQTGLPY